MRGYNKLVRDKIPEIIKNNGEKGIFKELDNQEYVQELRQKLLEETEEYMRAKNDTDAIEELSDVLEVIRSLSKTHGKSLQDVEEMRQKKFSERGGFEKKVYLIEVEDEI